MKTKKLILAGAALAMLPFHVHALSIDFDTCSSVACDSKAHIYVSPDNCDDFMETCYNNNGQSELFYSCNTCWDGYKRVRKTVSLSCGTVTYYACQENCDCTTGEWSASGTGYDTRTYCDSDTCELSTQCRCSVGYYGLVSCGSSGLGFGNVINNCIQCPEYGNVRGTSPAGSKKITECYIPGNTNFTDESGTGVFTGDCHHEDTGGPSIDIPTL